MEYLPLVGSIMATILGVLGTLIGVLVMSRLGYELDQIEKLTQEVRKQAADIGYLKGRLNGAKNHEKYC